MKLIWTAFAATQLENLYRFLNNKSETAAVAVYNDILDETERLLHFAEMAPIEPLLLEFTKAYRSLVIRSTFKVVYYTTNDDIFIVAVFDCRKNSEKLKKYIRKRKQQE